MGVFTCTTCGGIVSGRCYFDLSGDQISFSVIIVPSFPEFSRELPEKPRKYIEQAIGVLHTPDSAVMVAASSVDAMLKEKGLKDGSLFARINQAVNEGLLTKDMAIWAHQVKLDTNDPRHADEVNPHHTLESARMVVSFVEALGDILFTLPSLVSRGIQEATRLSQQLAASVDSEGGPKTSSTTI